MLSGQNTAQVVSVLASIHPPQARRAETRAEIREYGYLHGQEKRTAGMTMGSVSPNKQRHRHGRVSRPGMDVHVDACADAEAALGQVP